MSDEEGVVEEPPRSSPPLFGPHYHRCGNPACHKSFRCMSDIEHWTYLTKDEEASEVQKQLVLKPIHACCKECFDALFGSDSEDDEVPREEDCIE